VPLWEMIVNGKEAMGLQEGPVMMVFSGKNEK
jgi:hypothetical protein